MVPVTKSYRMDMPIGYRFMPTDEELAKYYLANKVFLKPLPVEIFQEIDSHDFNAKHPKYIVKEAVDDSFERNRKWYLFMYEDEYFGGKIKASLIVEGIGFWRFAGKEEPIFNSKGDVFASKVCFDLYAGTPKMANKTKWRMEKYRLHAEAFANTDQVEEWILGKIIHMKDYGGDSV